MNSSVNGPNSQFRAGLVTFTKEIFLYREASFFVQWLLMLLLASSSLSFVKTPK